MKKMMNIVLFIAALSVVTVMQSCDMKTSSEKTTEKAAEQTQKINVLADGHNAKPGRVDNMPLAGASL